MTTTIAAERPAGATASGWNDDVLRRVVKAWTAGYDITHEAFALGIGMNPRTFARRLAGSGRKQAFSAGEVADIAAYMSRITGSKVAVADLYAGRVLVFPSADSPDLIEDTLDFDPTNPCLSVLRPKIRSWRRLHLVAATAA